MIHAVAKLIRETHTECSPHAAMELPAFSAARRRVAAEPAEEEEELQGPQRCVPAVSGLTGLIILVLLFVTAGAMSSRRGGAGAAAPAGLGSAVAAGPAAPHLGHRRGDPGAGRPVVPAPTGREAIVLVDDDLRATCEQGDEQYMRDCLWPSNYAAYTLHKRAALVANGSTCSSLGFYFLRINAVFAGSRCRNTLSRVHSRSRGCHDLCCSLRRVYWRGGSNDSNSSDLLAADIGVTDRASPSAACRHSP